MWDGKIGIAVHTGAKPTNIYTREIEKLYKDGIFEALKLGWNLLKNGKDSLDVVETVVAELENNPLYNAGKGSFLNSEGVVELDASIMEGKHLRAGAVSCVTTIKNPIKYARFLLEENKFYFLCGAQAEAYAFNKNIVIVDNSYFFTENKIESYKNKMTSDNTLFDKKISLGTVGAVCLDTNGNLAAATSTGGVSHKIPGRVGDSCIIGAGNYANNETCAVSMTGVGEDIMKCNNAFEIHALIKYANYDLKSACNKTLQNLEVLNSTGGLIAIDKVGNIIMEYDTEQMGRGFVQDDGIFKIYLKREDEDLVRDEYNL